ncbi:MAG: hypothetical protein B7Z10_04660 [Rhodobacterales bacterium 32-66-7]|nr:MAG: hypothetical protein B7Z31_15630 [Rhodobacterales bacterium 12-65-15]OYX25964.1 MAG: hypothetical protein B7Z10_04660 [Rhodobacterales bacterium 32-66-7]
MSLQQKTAFGYALVLALVASLNYLPIPGLVDDQGRTFGIFALDIYDDALHLASALWALGAALVSTRAARIFLILFGGLYFLDGLLGCFAGSGFLDLGIFTWGVLDIPLQLKILSSVPHLVLGGVALVVGLRR